LSPDGELVISIECVGFPVIGHLKLDAIPNKGIILNFKWLFHNEENTIYRNTDYCNNKKARIW